LELRQRVLVTAGSYSELLTCDPRLFEEVQASADVRIATGARSIERGNLGEVVAIEVVWFNDDGCCSEVA
jgi:hypothetical protein